MATSTRAMREWAGGSAGASTFGAASRERRRELSERRARARACARVQEDLEAENARGRAERSDARNEREERAGGWACQPYDVMGAFILNVAEIWSREML